MVAVKRSPEAEARHKLQKKRSKRKKTTIAGRYESGDSSPMFIAWDCEGDEHGTYEENGARSCGCTEQCKQNVILFGCSAEPPLTGPKLSTEQMLGYMLDVKRRYPDAIHIAFSFDYDFNQIIQDAIQYAREWLYRYKSCTIGSYEVDYIPSKLLTVAKFTYDKELKPITIYDIFGFFTTSYLKALAEWDIPITIEDQKIIEEGKTTRGKFTYANIGDVYKYWAVEIKYMPVLANTIRDVCYNSGFFIHTWHGSSAIGRYMLDYNKVSHHMSRNNPEYEKLPSEIRLARKVAYAGGRFSQFKAGVYYGDVYVADLNSAYTAALRDLPSLATGKWIRKDPVEARKHIKDFALYRIHFCDVNPSRTPYPLFHRDKHNRITFPNEVVGYYWGPEARLVANDPRATFEAAWEWSNPKPVFHWVQSAYDRRMELKYPEKGPRKPAEKVYKWALSSMYGMFARRVGWQGRLGYKSKGSAPSTHQLEWAGYITSWCRAEMYKHALPIAEKDALIAINTDAMVSMIPFGPDVVEGKQLAQWEIKKYKGIIQWQSGVYWMLEEDGTWQQKSRGLRRGTLKRVDAETALRELEQRMTAVPAPGDDACVINATVHEFVKYQRARISHTDDEWRTWQTSTQENSLAAGRHDISCRRCRLLRKGWGGKRWNPKQFPMHDVDQFVFPGAESINSVSTPHHLPWEEPRKEYDDPNGAIVYDYDALTAETLEGRDESDDDIDEETNVDEEIFPLDYMKRVR